MRVRQAGLWLRGQLLAATVLGLLAAYAHAQGKAVIRVQKLQRDGVEASARAFRYCSPQLPELPPLPLLLQLPPLPPLLPPLPLAWSWGPLACSCCLGAPVLAAHAGCTCRLSRNDVPVLGQDGVTYANACLAKCQGATAAGALHAHTASPFPAPPPPNLMPPIATPSPTIGVCPPHSALLMHSCG